MKSSNSLWRSRPAAEGIAGFENIAVLRLMPAPSWRRSQASGRFGSSRTTRNRVKSVDQCSVLPASDSFCIGSVDVKP